MKKTRRVHRTKNIRPDSWSVTRTLVHHKDPKEQAIKGFTSVPEKCEKCGNPRLRVFTEKISAFSIQMIHCSASEGGCGKTWRLL